MMQTRLLTLPANHSVFDRLVRVHAAALVCASAMTAVAQSRPVEIHDRITQGSSADNRVALTLDACSGAFDEDLIGFLIRNRIPATLFATKKWLLKNPTGLALLKANLDLFDIENHGENHIPAVIGAGRKVYGITGEPDMLHLRREVQEGARAIEAATGVPSHWYRGATAEYDQQAADEIRRMGYKIAGFSVNADLGGDARFMAAQALGYIGAPAKRDRIVKTLKEMTTSKDERTREYATTALKNIGG